MCVCMALTTRSRSRTSSAKDFAGAIGAQAADLSRQARIEELRQMVAAGQYQVQPQKLALKILVRALKQN
jgi:anti-sigma28 factor (negative regulator of flagellin synthesis)